MSASTPRERRHQRTRDSIMNAAIALIRENGADKLSLRQVAKRIDYSPAGLYEYFGSKDELIDAVQQECGGRLGRYLRGVSTDLPLEDYFVEIGLAYVQFARENPEMFTLMFNSQSGPTELVTEETLHEDDAFTIAYRAVQAAIDANQITTHDGYNTLEIAYNLWAFVHGMAVLQVTHLSSFPLDFVQADRHGLRAFVRGLAIG